VLCCVVLSCLERLSTFGMVIFLAVEVERFVSWVTSHYLQSILLLIVFYIVYEQLFFYFKKRGLPGPTLVTPFIGGIISMVRDPYKFWHKQMDEHKFSWNTVIGYFMVILADYSTSRQVFEAVSADLPVALHPSAWKILGDNNIAFMNGSFHKQLRHRLLPLFTQRALGVYLSLQDQAIREHLAKWFEESKNLSSKGLEMKPRAWDLNSMTSLSVFVGPYLDEESRKTFKEDYRAVTNGFLAFPINLPGTMLNQAIRARHRIIDNLTIIAGRSKKCMASGEEPSCLLDFWMSNTIKEIETAKNNNEPPPPHSTDREVAHIVLDFLFASQDASTASLTWAIHFLCEYPDVLAKVREEQARIRPNNETITPELLSQMQYTWQVMKEILRFRPPATIVPHIAKKNYIVNDKVVAPKGSLVIPSIWSANREGWTNPDCFDVNRFSPERTGQFDKYFLTFGTGPHSCVGQRYAMNHIMLFIAILATEAEFTRKITPNMHEIMYAPTIYPADGCVLSSLKPLQTVSA